MRRTRVHSRPRPSARSGALLGAGAPLIEQPPAEGGVLDSLGPEVLQDLGVVAGALVLAYLLSALLTAGAARLTARTETDLDDAVIRELRPAVFLGLLSLAVWASLGHLDLRGRLAFVLTGAVGTVVAVACGRAVFRAALLVIRALSRTAGGRVGLPPRLVPVAEYAAQIVVWLSVLYGILVAWELEATLLQTSAGTVGLAVGLAAEGSLSNVVAGLFIHADRPCHAGDYLRLADGNRGRVTHIGLRSVRVLTDDNVEINIPNALFGAGRVVNETAGEAPDVRMQTKFVLPLTVDVERVRGIVAEMPALPHLSPRRRPEFRVLAVDERGVQVAVYFWLGDLTKRSPSFDEVNTWLYRRLTAAGVSFARPQHVMHVDAIAAALAAAGGSPAGPRGS